MKTRFLRAAIGLAALSVMLIQVSEAQDKTEIRVSSGPRRTDLMTITGGSVQGEQAIQLQNVDIRTSISGSMSESTIELVFFNPNNRVLEGNLQFPLTQNQQIIGFALDLNGKMRDAVPVEKAKGRQVFEEIQRRGIDPALLEVTQGNNFQLRVYPILPHATRTVRLHLMQALNRQQQHWELPLLLSYSKEAQKSKLSLQVNNANATPTAFAGTKRFNFEKNANGYSLNLDQQQLAGTEAITTQVKLDNTAQTYVQEFQNETYFFGEVPITSSQRPRNIAKTIGLLWDSSASGANRQIDAELTLLDRYFAAAGNVEVRLQRLRDRPEAIQIFQVSQGNWKALRKALETTVYDGASALKDWKAEAKVGEYLLFSDGLSNYGGKTFPSLNQQQILYAINSAASADHAWLQAISNKQHGQLIELKREDLNAASQQLLLEQVSVSEINANGANAVVLENSTIDGGLLRIAGKMLLPAAEVKVKLNINGKIETINLPIDATSKQHPLAAYQWAQYRLRNLAAAPEQNQGEIRRIGLKFGIPNAQASLIVLENMSDYIKYDIAPPADMLEEFRRLKSNYASQKMSLKRDHLNRIVTQFEERIQWWNMVYPKQKKKADEDSTVGASSQIRPERPPVLMATQVVPSPPLETRRMEVSERSAPVAVSDLSREQNASAKSERVQVTGGRIMRQVDAMPGQELSLAKLKSSSVEASASIGIALKRWTADAPYINRMKSASKTEIYNVYLDERPAYTNSSAFFLDAADLLKEKGQTELALRVLSNLAEMDLENRHILRILGYRLMELNAYELAIPVFEKVLTLAAEEPQSYRDLGLALAANKQYQAAIEQLNQVVQGTWDGRFRDIEIISLAELNAVIAEAQRTHNKIDISAIDPRLVKNLPLDVRVVMSWDADNSDMDLWVTDPSGEKCYFGHNRTQQGGRMSADVTAGYGPEEFALKSARPGIYKIEANFYGNRQQTVAGATTVQAKLITGFGTPNAKERILTLRLKERGDTVYIGEFEVKN